MAKRRSLRKRLRRLEVRLQRNPGVQRVLRGLIRSYIRLIHRTTRWRYLDLDLYGPAGDRTPAVLCVWHETLPGTTHALNVLERPTWALASDHPDGLLVVDVLRDLGFESLLVATSGDNTGPLREALRRLRGGASVCITTDGPLGPPRRSKPGAVTLAGLSGARLVAFGYATRPALRLPTWDRMLLPLPFGRGVISAGAPIDVPRRLDAAAIDALCARLDTALDAQMDRCAAALRSR